MLSLNYLFSIVKKIILIDGINDIEAKHLYNKD